MQCRNFKSKVPVRSIADKTIPGPDGNEIPIRIYHPDDAKPRRQGLPILVYFHGGCFFMGSIRTHDDLCRNLGHLSAHIVISVDYRYLLYGLCTGCYAAYQSGSLSVAAHRWHALPSTLS